MRRIDSSTVELTPQELRLGALHQAQLDAGLGHQDAFHAAWQELGEYAWLPTAEFVDWLIGPAPEEIVDEVCYGIFCVMQTCPDHGAVRFVDGGESPSMAGGHDSHEEWSCGCVIQTTPYSHSRRRPDGTYSDDCGDR